TKVALKSFEIIAPTLNLTAGNMNKLPIIIDNEQIERIDELVDQNIDISKRDWDSFEISWDYKKHPFIGVSENVSRVNDVFKRWKNYTAGLFNKLKKNEEEINRIFIEIYSLQEELTPDIVDEDVTIRKAHLERDIKSFISYAIGCSFGRYSLDEEGLIYAGGEFNASRYQTFTADEDNILPILAGAYFEDDIVTRFVDFVRVTFSDETLEENLDFITDAIGRKTNETAREALRRYFLNDFYKDHVQVYKKRPIYWLFTSGKEKAF